MKNPFGYSFSIIIFVLLFSAVYLAVGGVKYAIWLQQCSDMGGGAYTDGSISLACHRHSDFKILSRSPVMWPFHQPPSD